MLGLQSLLGFPERLFSELAFGNIQRHRQHVPDRDAVVFNRDFGLEPGLGLFTRFFFKLLVGNRFSRLEDLCIVRLGAIGSDGSKVFRTFADHLFRHDPPPPPPRSARCLFTRT